MLFSSMVFLWIFLPVSLLGSRLLPRKLINAFLVLISVVFYAWGEPIYVFLMLFSILLNWSIGILLSKSSKWKKASIVTGVTVNLLLLASFKYLGMLTQTLNSVFAHVGIPLLSVPEIKLPVGISFFTFQAISYIVDVYRENVPSQRKLLNVALYISFFPQLIAGPIVRYQDVNDQIENRELTFDKMNEGIRRFIYGLSKKILLSNVLAKSVDALYSVDIGLFSSGMAWLAAGMYALQIYYDFSGYSDMAIGLGKMFGFEFNENFHYPYVSRSIQEFWRRWHISLSTWFKEYVYIPLGGNRKGTARTYLHLFVVFFLTGLWHGASYNFVIWGLYHGVFQVIERLGLRKKLEKNQLLAWMYTMLVVVIGWVFFRVESLPNALHLIKRMLLPWMYSATPVSLQNYVNLQTVAAFVAGICGAGLIHIIFQKTKVEEYWKNSVLETIALLLLLLLNIASLASNTYNPFIYFRF